MAHDFFADDDCNEEWRSDHRASFTAFPSYFPGRSGAPAALLRSSIFALSERTACPRAVLPAFDDLTDSTEGATVEYKGAPLRQADLRVLLGLLARCGGMQRTEAWVAFDAAEFLESIGRATCSRSVDALRDSLSTLRSATFTVRNSARDKGRVFGLVNEVRWDKRRVLVQIAPALHDVMGHGAVTFVPMAKRKLLADGVQTALADLLLSSDTGRLEYEALAKLWHRENVKTVGTEVRAALDRLKEVGIVESWTAGRGVAHAVKTRAKAQ